MRSEGPMPKDPMGQMGPMICGHLQGATWENLRLFSFAHPAVPGDYRLIHVFPQFHNLRPGTRTLSCRSVRGEWSAGRSLPESLGGGSPVFVNRIFPCAT